MNELGPRARELIDAVGIADGPRAGTRERVRTALGATLGASAALGGSATAFGAQATAAGGSGAALTLAGKSTTAIAWWFVAGGVAGLSVATPLAVVAERPLPAAIAPSNQPPRVEPARPVLANPGEPATAPPAPLPPPNESAPSRRVANRPVVVRNPAAAREAAATPPPSDVATELALLKAAQRELNTANARASLALLDDHAQRYPDGALKAERLGARVFALCKLGRVEEARAAAREFMSTAADSPLVPRVLSSCGVRGSDPRR